MAVGKQHFSEGEPQDSPLQDQEQEALVAEFNAVLLHVRRHNYLDFIVRIHRENEETEPENPFRLMLAQWKMPPPLAKS